MNNILDGKVAIVIGMMSTTTSGIVSALLQEGCIVMAPAKNLQQLNWLKKIAAPMAAGRLITQLTDMPDYEKAQDIAAAIMEKFGRIDIAVTAMVANKIMTGLSETDMDDWENMLDESITPCFIMNRIIISIMKQEHQGVYVNVSGKIPEEKTCSSLSKMAAMVQMQLSKQFAEEAMNNGIRYYNLFVEAGDKSAPATAGHYPAFVTPETVGGQVIRLYADELVPA